MFCPYDGTKLNLRQARGNCNAGEYRSGALYECRECRTEFTQIDDGCDTRHFYGFHQAVEDSYGQTQWGIFDRQ